jgi:two-component system cell cycle response regulator PopA
MRALEWCRGVKAKGYIVAAQPRVLIMSENSPLLGPLAEGMARMGWAVRITASEAETLQALLDLPINAMILDLPASNHDSQADAMAGRFKAAVAPRQLPIIALGAPDGLLETPAFDLVLAAPLHPAQAVAHIEALVRSAIADEEFYLRQKTFAERGKRLERPLDQKFPLRILAIGEPAPQFLALSNILTKLGAQVVGAFTAYTAFDYLHEQTFDAVVMWGGTNATEALSIAGGMRRNTRLFHVPITLCTAVADSVTVTEAFRRGVSQVVCPDVTERDTAERIMELARAYCRQTAVRSALDRFRASGLMDEATGLFTRELFAAHLLSLSQSAVQCKRSLSVCVLRIIDSDEVRRARSEGWMDRALPQIGSMIGRLVRAEDTAARIAPEVFALALPATALHEGQAAAERIAAVIACTAFDAGADRPAFVAEFCLGVAQLKPGESAASALERAAAKALHPA